MTDWKFLFNISTQTKGEYFKRMKNAWKVNITADFKEMLSDGLTELNQLISKSDLANIVMNLLIS
jgi:hypothetical protein